MPRLGLHATAPALALALAACGDPAGAAAPPPPAAVSAHTAAAPTAPAPELGPEPLAGGLPGLRAVAEAVVAALAAGDRAALAALVVDEGEYKRRLFPLLANHASAHQMGPDLLWDMQSRESRDDLDRAVRLRGGRPLRLVDVRPRAVERRGGLVLHRAPVLVVDDGAGGPPEELHLLATVVEHEATGTAKLLAYRLRGGPAAAQPQDP